MGFGQPNMRATAAQQPGPGYGMPAMPVPAGQQRAPQAPPGGAGAAPKPQPMAALGVPSLYQSPMAKASKPNQFPADAVYNRVQQAILNPGPAAPPPAMPPAPTSPMMSGVMGPPTGPGQVNLGGGPTPVGRPTLSPGLLGPMAANYGPAPTGAPMGGAPDMAQMMQFMQQNLGGMA